MYFWPGTSEFVPGLPLISSGKGQFAIRMPPGTRWPKGKFAMNLCPGTIWPKGKFAMNL
jgi:hypothetical protein